MLRLVHPAPGGQGTDPPRRRKGHLSAALSLTPEEVQHLRAALRNLRHAFGTWACLEHAMGVGKGTVRGSVTRKGNRPHPALAIRAAQAAGMSVEAILSGKLSATGRCPTCGARAGGAR